MGELVGTAYEEYNPFENEISYESYEAVEKRHKNGKAWGIAVALAIGAVAALAIIATGGIAASVVVTAVAVGAVVAGVGIWAADKTYERDQKNSTASSEWAYIRNAGTASLITASVIATFWMAPYSAGAVTMGVTQGLPLTVLFGHILTLEEVNGLALIWTHGLAAINVLFQVNELFLFFAGTKELGEPTDCEWYNDAKALEEGYNLQMFSMGYEYRLQTRAAAKALAGSGGNKGQGTQAKGGRGANARIADEVLDSDLLKKVKSMKDQLPKWAKNKGNFGYGEVNIEGLDDTQFFAHSSIQTEIPSMKGSGISIKPESSLFIASKVSSTYVINGEGA